MIEKYFAGKSHFVFFLICLFIGFGILYMDIDQINRTNILEKMMSFMFLIFIMPRFMFHSLGLKDNRVKQKSLK